MDTLLNRIFLAVLSPFVGLILAWSPILAQEEAGSAPVVAATDTAELKAKDGQKVIVYGETARTGKSQSGMNFVNFSGAEFSLVTFKSDLGPFKDGEPADVYDGKRLVVTGVISIYKDKPQIKLTSPDQVRVLAGDEAWPAATSPKAAREKAVPAAAKPVAEPAKGAEEPKKKPPVDPKLYFK